MVVQHNLAPGKKEEKPGQCEISKNHNYCTCGAISLSHLKFHQLCPHLFTQYEFPQNMYEIEGARKPSEYPVLVPTNFLQFDSQSQILDNRLKLHLTYQVSNRVSPF